MATNDREFNDFVTCPLNGNHRVLRGRLAIHLDRCSRSAGNDCEKFLICPYNTTHRFIAAEMEDHKKVCESRFDSLTLLLEAEENVPKASPNLEQRAPPPLPVVECEDNWDLEPDVGTYKPEFHCTNNLIIRTLHGQSPSVRAEFRRNERRRFAEIKKNQEN